jgi:hypothetical protein
MPYGYYTIEQWQRPRRGAKGAWVAMGELDGCHKLTDALAWVEKRNKEGLYRVVQMQRVVHAAKVDGKWKRRKWHAGSAASLARMAAAFDRDAGKPPAKKR